MYKNSFTPSTVAVAAAELIWSHRELKIHLKKNFIIPITLVVVEKIWKQTNIRIYDDNDGNRKQKEFSSHKNTRES